MASAAATRSWADLQQLFWRVSRSGKPYISRQPRPRRPLRSQDPVTSTPTLHAASLRAPIETPFARLVEVAQQLREHQRVGGAVVGIAVVEQHMGLLGLARGVAHPRDPLLE